CGREDADDRRPGDRRVTPAGDHQQDGEEQSADERTEDEAETQVGRERAGERRPPPLLDERLRASSRRRKQSKGRDWSLRREDRAPVERLSQNPTERRAERDAESPGECPDRGSAGGRAAE